MRQNKNTDVRQKRWLPPLLLLPACLFSGLQLLFVLLQEGRGAELLLLLGVGRLGGRAFGGQRLLYLLAGAHCDLHALHAGGQLTDALGQLLVRVGVVVFAVHQAGVVLCGRKASQVS